MERKIEILGIKFGILDKQLLHNVNILIFITTNVTYSMKRLFRNITCFISAPYNMDVIPIKNLLKKMQIRAISPFDFSTQGLTMDEIVRRISQATFVIAILDKKENTQNIFFEAGFAKALNVPIIYIAPPGYELESQIYTFGDLVIYSHSEYLDTLETAIDARINKYKISNPNVTKSYSIGKLKPIGAKADRYLKELREKEHYLKENRLLEIISSVLKDAGISVQVEVREGKSRIDMVIWVDEIEIEFGNPIIVEIRKSIRDSSILTDILYLVKKYLNITNTNLALVLYLEGMESNNIQDKVNEKNILFFQIDELIKELKHNTIVAAIRNKRNKFAHGGWSSA